MYHQMEETMISTPGRHNLPCFLVFVLYLSPSSANPAVLVVTELILSARHRLKNF